MPVNWQAPLNRGLERWWKALPWLMRGPIWRDLTRRQAGVLTTGAVWKGTPRLGGVSAVSFDGSAAVVTIAVTRTVFTLAAWIRTSASTTQQILGGVGENNQWRVETDGNLRILTNSASEIDLTTTGVTLNDGKWHHVMATNTGTATALAVDGRIAGSVATGSVNARTWDCIGHRTGSGEGFNGEIDDVRIYSRALDASAIRALYTASRCGDVCEVLWAPWALAAVAAGRTTKNTRSLGLGRQHGMGFRTQIQPVG